MGPRTSWAAGGAEGGKGKTENEVSDPHEENSSWKSTEHRKPATASPPPTGVTVPQTGRTSAALPQAQGAAAQPLPITRNSAEAALKPREKGFQ